MTMHINLTVVHNDTSTYNTDYILIKEQNYDTALQLLADRGYEAL